MRQTTHLLIILSLLLFSCKKEDPPKDTPPDTNTPISASVNQYQYGSDPRQTLDLYHPGGTTNPNKVVFLVHGGGWVIGYNDGDTILTFKTAVLAIINDLLSEGYVCANLSYQLACYNTVSGNFTNNTHFYLNRMLNDIDSAMLFIEQNASTLNISPNSYALIGESAGAHMSLMYGLKNTSNSKLKTVVSCFSPTLLDEQTFKQNLVNNYANIPILAPNYFSQRANSCNMSNGSVNLLFALKSLADNNSVSNTVSTPLLDSISPAFTSNITRNLPIFLLHGTTDNLVPDFHADSLQNKLNSIYGTTSCTTNDFTCQHKVKKYSNCGHGFSGGSCNKSQIKSDIITWLQNKL